MRAIWTEEKIEELKLRQNDGSFHPYTCDRKHDECEVKQVPRDFSKDGVLIPTQNGWICPCGNYTQKVCY